MNWIGCVLILYLSVLSCFAQEKARYPVIWNEWLGIKSLSDIPATLGRQDYPVMYDKELYGQLQVSKGDNLMKQRKNVVTVSHCNQYFALKTQGYEPFTNRDLGIESWYIGRCIPLQLLQTAQPAQKSDVRDFNLAKDYGLLPAHLVFWDDTLTGNVKQAAQHFKVFKIEQDKQIPESISILADAEESIPNENGIYAYGQLTQISMLARGDFTHSGLDQIMLWISHSPVLGTLHWNKIYILQKNAEDADFQIIRELPSDKALSQAPAGE